MNEIMHEIRKMSRVSKKYRKICNMIDNLEDKDYFRLQDILEHAHIRDREDIGGYLADKSLLKYVDSRKSA